MVGLLVGEILGFSVGGFVGENDGCLVVGLLDGEGVSFCEGGFVGDDVGRFVVEEVGGSVSTNSIVSCHGYV